MGAAIGDQVIDLAPVASAQMLDGSQLFAEPTLNAFLALGRPAWRATRELAARAGPQRERPGHRRAAPDPAVRGDDATARSRSRTTSTSTPPSSTRPTSAGCSARTPNRCCRTGNTSRSATTAAPARSLPAAPTSSARRVSARPPTRRRADVRAVAAARHRGRARLRRRYAVRAREACVRWGFPGTRVRRGARERLVRPGSAGLGVRTARTVPRQVVRHVDLAVGGVAGRTGGRGRPAAAAGTRRCCRTSPATDLMNYDITFEVYWNGQLVS